MHNMTNCERDPPAAAGAAPVAICATTWHDVDRQMLIIITHHVAHAADWCQW